MFYVAHSVVIGRGVAFGNQFLTMGTSEKLAKIHQVISNGLLRQAEAYDMEIDPERMPSIHGMTILKEHPFAKTDRRRQ